MNHLLDEIVIFNLPNELIVLSKRTMPMKDKEEASGRGVRPTRENIRKKDLQDENHAILDGNVLRQLKALTVNRCFISLLATDPAAAKMQAFGEEIMESIEVSGYEFDLPQTSSSIFKLSKHEGARIHKMLKSNRLRKQEGGSGATVRDLTVIWIVILRNSDY